MDGINKGEVHESFNHEVYTTPALSFDNLSIEVAGLQLLTDSTFVFSKGSIFGITGSNGSGKTTLINTVTGFIKPSAGKVTYYNKYLPATHSPYEISRLGSGLARSFQTPFIVEYLSVLDNVLVGKRSSGTLHNTLNSNKSKYADSAVAIEILRMLNIEQYALDNAKLLSVGQRRKVCIARAVFSGAHILLFDEPYANLDIDSANLMTKWFRKLAAEGRTILIVEHRQDFIHQIADRLLLLVNGQLTDVTKTTKSC